MESHQECAGNVTFCHPLFQREPLQFAEVGASAECSVACASDHQKPGPTLLQIAHAIAQALNDRARERVHFGGALDPEQRPLGERLDGEGDFAQASGTFPSGAHLAVVEVDIETGKVKLRDMFAVDDAGRIVNTLLAEGQVHGGLAQGIGQALYEEFIYDADGNPLTGNFADYGFPSAAEVPSFVTVHMESPSPMNDLGAKGIGESGTIGATPAVQNAVVDALSHLGVRHIDMPCTAERVWRALEATK